MGSSFEMRNQISGMTFCAGLNRLSGGKPVFRRLFLSGSILALTGGLALAQMQSPSQTSPMQAPSQGAPMAAPSSNMSTARLLMADIYKANVYDNAENKIGDVSDLVISKDGDITTAVIGVGGFLGAGQKDIAVPFKELNITSRNDKEWLVLNRTKDQLKSMPAYEPTGHSAESSAPSLPTSNWLASDIYKASVYDNSENKLGGVTDLVMDNNGKIMTAVIGVGGVLGAGQKDVAVPFNELKITSRNGKEWIVLDRTKDDLKNAPGYDKNSEVKKM
jgi:sporulation protein YlmC with PRC-barrel domain